MITIADSDVSLTLTIVGRLTASDDPWRLPNTLEVAVEARLDGEPVRLTTAIDLPALRLFAWQAIRTIRQTPGLVTLVSRDGRLRLALDEGRMWAPNCEVRLFDPARADWVFRAFDMTSRGARAFEKSLVDTLAHYPTAMPEVALPPGPPAIEIDNDETGWIAPLMIGMADEIPRGYPAYAMLLHPIGGDYDSVPSFDPGPNDTMLRAARSPSVVGKLFAQWLSKVPDVLDERFTWKQLAERFDLPYDADLPSQEMRLRHTGEWPAFIPRAAEATLVPWVSRLLLEHLRPYTGDQTCYFFYCFLYMFHDKDYSEGKRFSGSLDTLMTFYQSDIRDLRANSPTMWWPEDRAWFVLTGYDSCESIIGGPVELIRALCDDTALEVVPLPESKIQEWLGILEARRGTRAAE